ncbi:MAG: CoA-binding protein [Alphaproteobacteria bacterium]|nr:MAG: CoA-binding protein [Alphaproteobacteria bacterium]
MSDKPDDDQLKALFRKVRTFACVGVSTNPVRPSYFVARYLTLKGFRVIPVNPGHAGKTLFGEVIRPSLADIPKDIRVDVVDIFRRPEAVPAIVDEALAHLDGLGVIWMQIGVRHDEAARKAREHGLTVLQDCCPKIEYQRLFGELHMGGFVTGIISSRL